MTHVPVDVMPAITTPFFAVSETRPQRRHEPGIGDAKGKGPYLEFCRTVIGSFEYHAMEIRRIFYSDDRRQACAETEETIQKPGEERLTLHCLKVHDIDEDGLIVGIDQYRKASPSQTPITLSVGAVMGAREY